MGTKLLNGYVAGKPDRKRRAETRGRKKRVLEL